MTVSILFLAALVQSTLGFGLALIAMPLLALVYDVPSAAALVAFCSLTSSTLMLVQQRREIEVSESAPLVISAAAGVPLGLLVIRRAPEDLVTALLGALVAAFSLYMLFRPRLVELKQPRLKYLFGFVGGIFGGAYNISGPPVILYGALRRWPPQRFRVILQGFFLPTSILIWIGHGLTGLWTEEVLRLFVFALPALVVGTFAGHWLNQRLPTEFFTKVVYGMCVGLGVLIMF